MNNVPDVQPRNISRRDVETTRQVWLLNEDLDSHDRQLAALRSDMRGEVKQLREELRNTNRILLGLLITIASAALVGTMNLLFGAV